METNNETKSPGSEILPEDLEMFGLVWFDQYTSDKQALNSDVEEAEDPEEALERTLEDWDWTKYDQHTSLRRERIISLGIVFAKVV